MKQISQSFKTGTVKVDDVPAPVVTPGTVLVQNYFSLVSAGTEKLILELGQKSLIGKAKARPDLVGRVLDKVRTQGVVTATKAVLSQLNRPVAVGYSSAGIVLQVGEGVDGFNVGDQVACAGAGNAVHAEIVRVPINLVAKVPDGVDLSAAAFTTLGAIALHGFRLSEVKLGERVVILGLGLVGLLAVQVGKAAGCTVVGMDPDPSRCRLGERLGCDSTCSSEEQLRGVIETYCDGAGADAVVICASTENSQPVVLAGEIARDRANVVVIGAVGMDIPRRTYYEKELTLKVSRSYGPGRYDPLFEEKGFDYPLAYVRWTETRNMSAFLDLVGSGKMNLDSLISHRFPVEQAGNAYQLLSGANKEPFLGILIEYPERADLSSRVSLRTPKASFVKHPSQGERVVVGLLGAGNFAQGVLLPEMTKQRSIELAAICSSSGLSAQHVGKRFGFQYCTADAEEVLSDSNINVIVIATPHNQHSSQTVQALASGKHVFCEKPLALSYDELQHVAQAVQESSGQTLMVGYNRRFSETVTKLKNFRAGLQDPLIVHYRINAGYVPSDHWVQDPEIGGGRILGEVCHFVDLLSYLVESEPVRVYARALPNGGRYRDDNASIVLEFDNHSVATITYAAAGDRAFPKERIELFASGAVAVLDDFKRLELVQGGRKQVHKTRLGDKGHGGGWSAFVSSIRDGVFPISFRDLMATSLTTFQILKSLRCGQPVDIEVDAFIRNLPQVDV